MTVTVDRIETCPIIGWDDLTDAQRAEFDYLDTDDAQMEADFASYRGMIYHISEFMVISSGSPFPGQWDGYHGDSFFSGVLIRLKDDDEVSMGTYFS